MDMYALCIKYCLEIGRCYFYSKYIIKWRKKKETTLCIENREYIKIMRS